VPAESARLKAAFNPAFWMPEQQAFATALDGANVKSTPSLRIWAIAWGPASSTTTRPPQWQRISWDLC